MTDQYPSESDPKQQIDLTRKAGVHEKPKQIFSIDIIPPYIRFLPFEIISGNVYKQA